MGVQFGGDDPIDSPNPDANYFSSVDGNYGFGDGWTTPGARLADGSPDPAHPGSGSAPLTPGDYLVKMEIPNDPLHPERKLYTPTREEDVNVFSGDRFKPGYPPAPCAGACTPCISRIPTSSTRAEARQRDRRGRSATSSSCRPGQKSIAPTF